MSDAHSDKWRRSILISIFNGSKTDVWRQTKTNQLFLCRFHHSEGEGLVEVFSGNANAPGLLAFQVSMHGRVLGLLRIEPNGRERIVFDRDEGLGDLFMAEEMAAVLLKMLAHAVTGRSAEDTQSFAEGVSRQTEGGPMPPNF